VAIVGKSGSGKSTILKLIEGILLPNDGEVLLDGIPLIKTDREDFSSSVAIVSQEPHLMRGTVEQNIVFSNPDIGIMDVRRAAEAACIREDIEKHPGGFETMIDPSNSEFSGGQVQRLMIARALAIKPSILILDEATSALDTLIEEEIMENIRKLGITTIIVAHRLSSIRDCDTIYVVDQGSIVEQGSHDELMADQNSLYYSLVATGGAETK
jgi:ABC-type bacteriocin/lantibiotic exporter with double-glycine peptidase domain